MENQAIKNWADKDKLTAAVLTGIHGTPELKKDEKLYHLGEFRERILKLLSKQQAAEAFMYAEIEIALQDERAVKLLISGDIGKQNIEKYRNLATQYGKFSTIINDPSLKGEVGLAVVSDEGLDVDNIEVEERTVRLKRLGLSEPLIEAVGKKVCKACYEDVKRLAPLEAKNYRTLSWLDYLFQDNCPAH